MIDFHSQLSIIPKVYETAELQDNLEHSGGITISWKSATDDEIPLGSYITYGGTRYVLMQPYAPTKESMVHFKYDPQFKHPQALLDFTPFWIKSLDAQSQPIDLRTTSFTGFPYIIAQKVVDFMAEYANEMQDDFFAETVGLIKDANDQWTATWTYNISVAVDEQGQTIDPHTIITVPFDGCSIKSAADAIANAMGCNVFWDWSTKTIRFVAGTTIQGETYNCFHVLGGTTNMGKNTVSGGFAAVTQRLTLRTEPVEEHPEIPYFPGSIIDHRPVDEQGQHYGIRLTKDLYLDDIYPKMELYICYTHERLCYLTDENGEFIVDHYDENDNPVYKTFAKWYVRLSYDKAGQLPYKFDQSKLINDKVLSLLFQIDLQHPENMSSLVSRQFELTYFPGRTMEWDKTDSVGQSSAYETYTGLTDEQMAEISEFRIAVAAEGENILPTTTAGQLYPEVGKKVTLVNVALTDEKEVAQDELLAAANEIITLMETPAGEYTETVLIGKELNGRLIESVIIGQENPLEPAATRKHGPVVTNINHNLDTDVAEVTVGSWTRKTRTGGTADKLETVSVSANASTTGGDAYSDGSIGEGGGYTPKGTNSNEQTTINQTILKPDSLFAAYLSNTIDVVACDAEGKTKLATNIYTRISAFYGTKDVTTSCSVALPAGYTIPTGIHIFLEEAPGNVTTTHAITEDNKDYELTDSLRWLRINFPVNFDMAAQNDKIEFPFIIDHPAHTERPLSLIVQSMRPGSNNVRLDLDNEADMLSVDSNNKTRFARTITTNARIYDGASVATSGVGFETNKADLVRDLTFTVGSTSIVPTISDTVNGVVTITWTFAKGVSVVGGDKTVKLKYNGVVYSKVFSLGILDTDAIYQLSPSLSAVNFTRSTDNTLTPPSRALGLKLTKYDGESTSELTECPTSYAVRYAFDNPIDSYTDGSVWSVTNHVFDDITINNSTTSENVNIALFYEAGSNNWILIDRETVPIIKDGEHGTSPYFADIDNEMDSVACDANGNTTTGYDAYIGVHVWHGSKEENLTKLLTNSITGFTITPDAAHKRIRVQVTSRTLISQVNTINITIASADSGDKTLHFVLNGVRPGADGVTPTLFSLVPNTNVIVKKKDGTTNVEYVSCSVGAQSAINNAYGYEDYPVSGMEQEGDTVLLDYSSSDDMIDVYTEGSWEGGSVPLGTLYRVGSTIYEARENGWYAYTPEIRYQIDGGTEQPYSTQISVSLINNNIRFRLLVEDVQRDVETIPVVADGDDAVGYEIDFSQDTIVIPSDQSSVTIAAFTGTFYEVVGSTRTQKMSAFVLWNRKTDGTYERVMYHRNAGGFEKQDLVVGDDVEALVVTLQETLTNNPSVYYYKQEVPVLKNGDSGEPGDDAPYYKDEYALSSSRSSHPSEDDDSSWSPNQPSPTEQAPYVWKRSRLFDPNTNTWATGSSWVYVCLTGEDGGQGEQGNAYTLKTSPSQLVYNPNGPGWVGVNNFTVTRLNNGEEVSTGSLVVTAIPESGRSSTIQPSSDSTYSADGYESYVRFDIEWKDGSNNTIAQASVPIVRFGENGGTGSAGHIGRWYYYGGEYTSGTTYYLQETQAPFVKGSDGNFYMLDFGKDGSATGSTTQNPVDHHNPASGVGTEPWTLMQSTMQYYIAQAYFGSYAHLGSFIINGDWIISQAGTLNGSSSNDYSKFDPSSPNESSYGSHTAPNGETWYGYNFVPNFAVNGSSGATYQNDAHVRGEINAESGTIGGFKIGSTTIQDTGNTPTLILDSGNKKITVGDLSLTHDESSSTYQTYGLESKTGSFFIGTILDNGNHGGRVLLYPGDFSTNGGFIDLRAAGGSTQSFIHMGRSVTKVSVNIDAIGNNANYPSGKIVLKKISGSSELNEISLDSSTGEVKAPIIKATSELSLTNIRRVASNSVNVTETDTIVLVDYDGDANVYLGNATPSNGHIVVIIKRQGGYCRIYQGTSSNTIRQLANITDATCNSKVCVYYNGWY